MSEQLTNRSETPTFVTVAEARQTISKLADLAPRGGTLFGFKSEFHVVSSLSTTDRDGDHRWRIAVAITIPRFANAVCAQLANWHWPWSTREISFVVTGCDEPSIHYQVLNGSFQAHAFSTEIEQARRFRDRKAGSWYGTLFHTGDFEDIVKVLRSEITGEPAFNSNERK